MRTVTQKDICTYLDKCGWQHSLVGYRYAVALISHCLQNPDATYSICDTYKVIAEKFSTTPSSVERAIRHQLEIVSPNETKNKEFLARAIHSIQLDVIGRIGVAMNKHIIAITHPQLADGWIKGTIGKYSFSAKVYAERSTYGINDGRVSKLGIYDDVVRRKECNYFKACIVNYDRGWDIEPKTDEQREILNDLLAYLEQLPIPEGE